MWSRLLLAVTPVAALSLLWHVPPTGQASVAREVQLAPVVSATVSETGDYRPEPTVRPVSFESAADSEFPVTMDRANADQSPVVAGKTRSNETITQLRTLSERYWSSPELRNEFQSDLRRVADRVYFAASEHFVPPHIVGPGETLTMIANRFAVTPEYLADVNHLPHAELVEGQLLKVTPGPFAAIFERTRATLTLHAHGHIVAIFPANASAALPPPGLYTVRSRDRGELLALTNVDHPNAPVWLGRSLAPTDLADVRRWLSVGAVVEIR